MHKTIQARHGMLQSGLQKVLDAQYEKGWEYIGSHGDELIFKRRENIPIVDISMYPGLSYLVKTELADTLEDIIRLPLGSEEG